MSEQLGSFVAQHTLYAYYRPFGAASIVGGVDEDGPQLFMIEPSGLYWVDHVYEYSNDRDISVLQRERGNKLPKMNLRNLI
jgi:20S proteasome subunit alpha 7